MIREKAFRFSVRIVRMVKYLENEHREYILSKQVKKAVQVSARMLRKQNTGRAALISCPRIPLL